MHTNMYNFNLSFDWVIFQNTKVLKNYVASRCVAEEEEEEEEISPRLPYGTIIKNDY